MKIRGKIEKLIINIILICENDNYCKPKKFIQINNYCESKEGIFNGCPWMIYEIQ